MSVFFKNCGNIKEATLNIVKDKINLKYGLNGIGKTTLGKCLNASINSNQELLKRYISYGTSSIPEVIQSRFRSSLYFDDEYVENYLFKEDLINKSFEIVVKTPDYDSRMNEIQQSFSSLIEEIQNENISQISIELQTLTNSIKFKSKSNDFDGKAAFTKGVNKINPEKILDSNAMLYKELIKSPDNHSWIEWFRSGKSFIKDNNCPFCLTKLPSDFDDKYDSVTQSFEKNSLKNSAESNATLATFRKYVDSTTANQIIMDQQIGIISDKTKAIIKANVEVLTIEKAKLDAIRRIDPLSMISLTKPELSARFASYKLNDEFFANVSPELGEKIKTINSKLETVISKVDELNIQLNRLKATLSGNTKKVSDFVNDFLLIAGIPYKIEVEVDSQHSARTILKPYNVDMEITDPKLSLSYGELNSVSLILFCIEAISKNYDLIILDDPVSSFDGNKKYAIMYQLFSSKVGTNLRGKTVLLFTHDFTPLIDFIYLGLPTQNETVAYYLYNNNHKLLESIVNKADIISCVENELISAKNSTKNLLNRIVSLRNYFDMTKLNESLEHQLLSSLLHLKEVPTKKDYSAFDPINFLEANNNIKKYIFDFDYSNSYTYLSNPTNLKAIFNSGTSIDKIYTTRLLLTIEPAKQNNKVLWKFLNENFHPQNILFYGLDNSRFELIPEHILKSCDELFSAI